MLAIMYLFMIRAFILVASSLCCLKMVKTIGGQLSDDLKIEGFSHLKATFNVLRQHNLSYRVRAPSGQPRNFELFQYLIPVVFYMVKQDARARDARATRAKVVFATLKQHFLCQSHETFTRQFGLTQATQGTWN